MNYANFYVFHYQQNKSAGKILVNSYKILRKMEIENRKFLRFLDNLENEVRLIHLYQFV